MSPITCTAPSPTLRPFVAVYWHLNAPMSSRDIQSYLPGLAMAWIFNLGDAGHSVTGAAQTRLPHAFLKGPTTRSSHVLPGAVTENVGVAFKPGAGAAFMAMPMRDLKDQLVDLDATGDAGLRDLARCVQRCDPTQAAHVMDRFLLQRLDEARDIHLGPLLFQRLAQVGDRQTDLLQSTGYSARHLRRVSLQTLGASPKTVERVMRLRRVVADMTATDRSLADIASAAGYFDQAHFNRDFKAMMGQSPTAYRTRMASLADTFNRFETRPRFDQSLS